jgi:hypothetical protein
VADSCGAEVSGDEDGELSGMTERGEVPAGHDDGLDAEPLPGDALLELEGEEPVVTAGHDVDRNRWPGVKTLRRDDRLRVVPGVGIS